MSVKELVQSDRFDKLQAFYQMQASELSDRQKRQHDLFGRAVNTAQNLGIENNLWAFGAFSCMPEFGAACLPYARPHIDVDILTEDEDTMWKLANSMKLKEARRLCLTGSPIHFFHDEHGIALEIRHLGGRLDHHDLSQKFKTPKWSRILAPGNVGAPRSGLTDPDSVFDWDGVKCKRVHPEWTYLVKQKSPHNKDWYDARFLEMSGKLDYARMRKILHELELTHLDLMLPERAVAIIRSARNVWGVSGNVFHSLYSDDVSSLRN